MEIYRGHFRCRFYALLYLNKYRNKLLKGKSFELKYFKNRGIKLELAKFYLPLHSQCPDGEMVDALVSGASAERRVGSSPILGTSKKEFSVRGNSFFWGGE